MSDVCQTCGLCCDGSLFTIVPLATDEDVPSILPIITRADGSRAFRQKCPALAGTCCTVYEARPQACQRHECLLFRAVTDKEVDLGEAAAVVARAKALIAEASPRTKAYLALNFGLR